LSTIAANQIVQLEPLFESHFVGEERGAGGGILFLNAIGATEVRKRCNIAFTTVNGHISEIFSDCNIDATLQ